MPNRLAACASVLSDVKAQTVIEAQALKLSS